MDRQSVHKLRCNLLNALHDDKEELASADREVAKLVSEISAAYEFRGEAQRYLETICPHKEWNWCTIYYCYTCDLCGKCRDSRPENYTKDYP